jgi:hypothetical protein
MELQVSLGTILSRLPGLRLAVPESDLTWQEGTTMQGLTTFPPPGTPADRGLSVLPRELAMPGNRRPDDGLRIAPAPSLCLLVTTISDALADPSRTGRSAPYASPLH